MLTCTEIKFQPCLPRWGGLLIGAAAISLVAGGIISTVLLYGSLGSTSLFCLTGSASGVAILATTLILSLKRKSQLKSDGENPNVSLEEKNRALKEAILATPMSFEDLEGYVYNPIESDPIKQAKSLYTPVNAIFDDLYLGNLQSFLSIDPAFSEKYSATAPEEEIYEAGVDLTKEEYQQLANGSRDLGIKLVVSVTIVEINNMEKGHWSHFKPELDRLGVTRFEILTYDDDEAWKIIRENLEEKFAAIDAARARGEKVLIHCSAGASRSAAFVYAYLMSRCGVSLAQAFNYVRSIRPIVQLKEKMYEGLKEYEAELEIA